MNRMSIVILWALALLVLQPALAAEPRQQPTAREQARTVTIFHQPVVMLQATFGQTTPEERVLRTRSALRAFTEDDIRPAAAGRAGYPLWSARQTVSDERQTGAAAEPGGSRRGR
ncbi:ATPase [Klebsiella pneumoniae]|nr:ATPase [Klebsiella pneumoniae]